jgi:hypothetical protein
MTVLRSQTFKYGWLHARPNFLTALALLAQGVRKRARAERVRHRWLLHAGNHH